MSLPIGQIVQGTTYNVFNINEDLSQSRLKICYSCPLYTKDGRCNNKLWLNVNTGDVSTEQKEGYKRGCACILKSKTRVPSAHCPVNKW